MVTVQTFRFMGIFGKFLGKGNSGGVINVIRCDEPEYLVWKWRPLGQEANSTSRENAIRYGSTLVVKDGETAVFMYKNPQGGGVLQDFIEGPYQDTIKTKNFPVLATLQGGLFGGESPFQAEVYFMNTQGNNQMKFAVPYFDVTDPRNMDLPVPVAVRGTITFNLTDCRQFIKLNRLVNFDIEQFRKQIKDTLIKIVKALVTTTPTQNGIPLVRMETQIIHINDIIQQHLAKRFVNDYGVNLKALDISAIDLDKDTQAYRTLKAITQDVSVKQTQQQSDIALRTNEAQAMANIQNMLDTQQINAENMAETMRIQREAMEAAQRAKTEEAQRSGRMQTQTTFAQANILDKQVQMVEAASKGMAGGANASGNAMNPGAMMAGMAMGGAIGQQMAGMVNQMGNMANQALNTPPPMPGSKMYHVAVNGQQYGPYDINTLRQMVQQGQVNAQTMVWTQGMPQWAAAPTVSELAPLFAPPAMGGTPPPPIPNGQVPPAPPTL